MAKTIVTQFGEFLNYDNLVRIGIITNWEDAEIDEESGTITPDYIGDFLKTARKYDVDFALKRDKSTTPPTYHVFFSAAKTEDFKRAFSEYVGKGQGKSQKRGEFTREQMQQQAQKLRSKPRKQKQREKTRENRR